MQDFKYLEEKIKLLPHSPGCYLFKNEAHEIIYVGKANDLKKRVLSYLQRAGNLKTMQLVRDIRDLEFINTTNEKEALILEQTLIKKNRPRYNILLADDKKYPYIQITNVKDPGYRYVRQAYKNQGKFYGPFPDGTGAREMLKLLERLFPLRKCQGKLHKPCLYYNLGQCSGACFKEVPAEYYKNMISKIDSFFKGNVAGVKKQLSERMSLAAQNLQYEEAGRNKQLLEKIDKFLDNQVVEFDNDKNLDFINYYEKDEYISVSTLFYRNGKLQSKDDKVIFNSSLDVNDLLRNYIVQLYQRNILPDTLFVPSEINKIELQEVLIDVEIKSPAKGSKTKILDLGKTNAMYAYENYFINISPKNTLTENLIQKLGMWLEIPTPNWIEMFDIANLQQSAIVAGMIVYKRGKPLVEEYRHYLINPETTNDYDRIKEVIYRRYFNLLINKQSLPDLIIVDGGKPQISAALTQLHLLDLKIKVVGLIKNKRHETSRVMDDKFNEIMIPENDPLFKFLANMQTQVHKYTIKFHQDKRSQAQISPLLASVPGLGPVVQQRIMQVFPLTSDLKSANYDDLNKVIKNKKITTDLMNILKNLA